MLHPRLPGLRVLRATLQGVLVGLLMIWAGTVVLADVADLIGKPVVTVQLINDGQPMRDPSTFDLLETHVGAPLSMRQVRESVTHLFSLGRFERVEVDGTLNGGGVALRYEVVPLRLVDRVEIVGDVGVSAGDVRREIADGFGVSFPVDLAPAVTETLQRFYRERGFLSARVRAEMDDRQTQSSGVMRVVVEAGSRAQIAQIFVTGVPASLYQPVLARLGLAPGQPYDGIEIDQRLSDYERELRSARYYEAVLSHDIDVVDDGRTVHLRLDLRRGPRITIEFVGDAVEGVDIDELVPIEREASVDEDLLEDSDRRITRALRDRGYRDAVVTHRRVANDDELAIIFTVRRGRIYEIGDIRFYGQTAVTRDTLTELLGLTPGDRLVVRSLEVGVASVAEHYRQLGYATVRVEPRLVELPMDAPREVARVACEIEVDEGVRTRVGSIRLEGNRFYDHRELAATMTVAVGDPYNAHHVVEDRDRIRRRYLNDGFERVVVNVDPQFNESLEAVDLLYQVAEGPQIEIEHVLVVGNEQVDTTTIRRELALEPGRPLSPANIAETRRRLNALGLFRRIDIREFSHGDERHRDIVVVVNEAPATRMAYGGGVEISQRLRREVGTVGSQAAERLELAPRGFFEIGRRNLWGRNRSIDLFTRVSVRRKNDPVTSSATDPERTLGFNEYRVLATYREPRTFGLAWDIFASAFVEQSIRPGFDLFSRGLNAEIRRQITPTMNASVGYGWGQNNTSNKELSSEDEPLVDRLFPEVRLSTISASLLRDTRDDQVDPTDGEVLSIDGVLAARTLGSEVGFTKTFMQGFIYRPVPGLRRVTFAGGARVGLAVGFPRMVDSDGAPVEVRALPLSERFFAGGDTTVRGFALDRLGVPSGEPGATINEEGFPQGGNALVILNGELRIPVTRDFGVVGFIDAGNVYDRVSSITLGQIRAGVGFGVRYRSPLGPLRVDLGFKLDRQEFGSGSTRELEQLTALHISIGQAF